MLNIDQLPRECPLCKNAGDMVYLQDADDGWSYVCLKCTCVTINRARDYARDKGLNLYTQYPGDAPGETFEHSPLSEPLTIDDMLYETLGYYS